MDLTHCGGTKYHIIVLKSGETYIFVFDNQTWKERTLENKTFVDLGCLS